MTVVYLDSVFVLNGLMDYLLILAAGRLAGVPLRRGRYLLAAALGGTYAAAAFLPGLGFLSAGPVKLAAGVLMAAAAFGGEEHLARLTLLLFAVSCAMAGCVLALELLSGSRVPMAGGIFYTDIDAKALLISAAAADLVLTAAFRASARHAVRGELVPVTLCVLGKTVSLTALLDNGNSLREPHSGRPVLVLAPGALDPVLPRRARALLTRENLSAPADLLPLLRQAAPELRPRLLSYRAVGTAGGLLAVIHTDWTEIGGERLEGLAAALSPTALECGCAALWGGEYRRSGREAPCRP